MARHFLKLIEQLLLWCSEYIVDFVNLVQLIGTWEQWCQREHFEKDAANTPVVHFVVVIAIG